MSLVRTVLALFLLGNLALGPKMVDKRSKILHDEPLPGTQMVQGSNAPSCSAEAHSVTLKSMADPQNFTEY